MPAIFSAELGAAAFGAAFARGFAFLAAGLRAAEEAVGLDDDFAAMFKTPLVSGTTRLDRPRGKGAQLGGA
jgi:hypothetical protein